MNPQRAVSAGVPGDALEERLALAGHLWRVDLGTRPPNAPSEDVVCDNVLADEAEWRQVRSAAVDVAGRAAFLGYAADEVGPWAVCGQRLTIPGPGLAVAQVSIWLLHRHQTVRRFVGRVPLHKGAE